MVEDQINATVGKEQEMREHDKQRNLEHLERLLRAFYRNPTSVMSVATEAQAAHFAIVFLVKGGRATIEECFQVETKVRRAFKWPAIERVIELDAIEKDAEFKKRLDDEWAERKQSAQKQDDFIVPTPREVEEAREVRITKPYQIR